MDHGWRFSDCVIKPGDKSRNAVVVEFKHVKAPEGDGAMDAGSLIAQAQRGLEQIGEKAYTHNLWQEGYRNILLYGIAFHKKSCEVVLETAAV